VDLAQLGLGEAGLGRELDFRRLPVQLLAQRFGAASHLPAAFVQPARLADDGGLVAEVVADLAGDLVGGVGAELDADGGVEGVDSLDEPDLGFLGDVLVGLSGSAEVARDLLGELDVRADQLLTDLLIRRLHETGKQRLDRRRRSG